MNFNKLLLISIFISQQLYYRDKDNDNYGLSQDSKCLCAKEGVYTAVHPGDCNDLDPDINPKNMEIIDLNGSTIDTFAYGRNLITSLKPSCPNYTSFDLLADFKPLNNNLSLQYWHSNSGFFYSTYWFFNQVSGERVELQDNLFFIIDRNL